MIVKGLVGQAYQLEEKPFSSGGEGEIFSVFGDSTKVVKIYHADRITKELEEKLKIMANNPPNASILSQVAWPLDVVYDERHQFCGFVMPKLSITAELSEVYVYPPRTNITYKQKLILAQNICVVIAEIHKAGYIFGDFNPRNIGINTMTGTVAFLDTDSYHIVVDKKENIAYRCNVCASGYVAPELLEKCRAHITAHPEDSKQAYAKTPLDTFTKETDHFALAIHIFKLLMNGYTPFGGIKENESASVGCPGVGDEAVRRDNYCFKVGNKPQAAAVPNLDALPKEIAELFIRAFIQGKIDPKQRPSALEWHTALEQFESKLKICNKNITHLYLEDLVACPWCEADNRYMASITKPLVQKNFTTPVMASNSYSIGSYYTGGNLSTGNIHNSPNFNTSNRTNSQNLKNVFGFLSTLKSKLDKKWLIGIGIIVVLLVLFFIGTHGSSFLDTKGNMQEETEMYDFLYVSSPKNNVFVVPSIVPQFGFSDNASNDLSETELKKSEVDISDFTEFADCLEYEQQTKDYTFTVPTDGTYRFEITKMLNGIMVEFRILDAQKAIVEENAYCESGEGITLKNTKAGEVYEIQVKQKKGLGEYVLQLGKQKEVLNVSDFTRVTDSLEFKEQNNRYSFTPCNDGIYHFELSGMPNGTSVELYILNAFQEVVQSEPYCLNGEGVTVENMKAGETYEIQVRQHIGFSGYQISIGHQKDTVAITNHLLVADKITYTNQKNAYSFCADMPGTATFTIVGMEQGMAVSVYVINEMGETVASEPYCQNEEKIEIQDVFVGEEYQVFVKQRNGVGTYQLIID